MAIKPEGRGKALMARPLREELFLRLPLVITTSADISVMVWTPRPSRVAETAKMLQKRGDFKVTERDLLILRVKWRIE